MVKNKVKFVAVPQSDLDKLEQARKELFKLVAPDGKYPPYGLFGITSIMWRLAHKKYKECNSIQPICCECKGYKSQDILCICPDCLKKLIVLNRDDPEFEGIRTLGFINEKSRT